MKLKITLLLIAFISILNIKAQTVKIGATTYGTITEAITAAVDGDIIEITGIHTEPISISKSITLRGTDPTTDIIQAALTSLKDGSGSRVINLVGEPSELFINIENLGIRNGNPVSTLNGGGIFVDKITGLVNLKNLIIEENYTPRNGGGISIDGSIVNITECVIRNNSSGTTSNGSGGGIIIANNNNAATKDVVVNISQTLIDSNTSLNGAGIHVNAANSATAQKKVALNIENTTISNNSATSGTGAQGGGAINFASAASGATLGTLQLVHVTTYGNTHTAPIKSGVQFSGASLANFSVYNSIIVGTDNLTSTDPKAINFANTNIIGIKNCIFGGTNAPPTLLSDTTLATENNILSGRTATQAGLTGTLTNEGGKSQVFAIIEGSNADDFCTATVPFTSLTIDQRGATREGVADAGAYEFGGVLSTKTNDFMNLAIYPNPVKNVLFVKGVNDIQSLELYNILGKQVKKITNSNSMNVENLSKGVYLLNIINNNSSTTKKIIID